MQKTTYRAPAAEKIGWVTKPGVNPTIADLEAIQTGFEHQLDICHGRGGEAIIIDPPGVHERTRLDVIMASTDLFEHRRINL